MVRYYCLVLFLSVSLLVGCTSKHTQKSPVLLTWEMGANGIESRYYDNSFVIKNTSKDTLNAEWVIYFSQLPMHIKQAADAPVKIEAINGNFFKMYPTAYYRPIVSGDSLRITFLATNSIIKISQAPEGTYFQSLVGGEQTPVAIPLEVKPFTNELQWSRPGVAELPFPNGKYVYEENLLFSESLPLASADILPAVKDVVYREGKMLIDNTIHLEFDTSFGNEANILSEKLQQIYQAKISSEGKTVIVLEQFPEEMTPVNSEHYLLNVEHNRIIIKGATPHAIFNGVQTLLGMLKNKTLPCELEQMTISDYPDLSYRGLMLDVARNFTTKDNLLKLIDRISSYKLNVLHLHFSDDEGWRIEIPGLEELTTVGAHRGFTHDEQTCLYPAYDGNFNPSCKKSLSNGYYSRLDFINLLKFAKSRHIQIIPEIELPGHARAAVVAMKARYHKYIASDKAKAMEYLLTDFADTSKYLSIQYYDDNVVNVALPSTYRFVEKVVDELFLMYQDAGVSLTTIHVGGDEVPEGVWLGSPACQKLMAQQGWVNIQQLSSYFLINLNELLEKKDIQLSGWQEVALNHDAATDSLLLKNMGGVYCWNTVPGWGYEEVPYQVANKGYPVILCNVNNFYMDMAYNKHPEEPGLYWGGFVNEYNSYNMLPYDIYKSSRKDRRGIPVDLVQAAAGKTALNLAARVNIKGVQAQLFSETIRKYSNVEYYIFPKIFGLVERGWNVMPAWSLLKDVQAQDSAYKQALRHYNAKITQRELPYLNREGINFRVAQPGLIIIDGKLYVNSSIPGADVRYTLDGSEPTETSVLWTKPIKCETTLIKGKLFYQGKGSVTTVLKQ